MGPPDPSCLAFEAGHPKQLFKSKALFRIIVYEAASVPTFLSPRVFVSPDRSAQTAVQSMDEWLSRFFYNIVIDIGYGLGVLRPEIRTRIEREGPRTANRVDRPQARSRLRRQLDFVRRFH